MESNQQKIESYKQIVVTLKRSYEQILKNMDEMINLTSENNMEKAEELKKQVIERYQKLLLTLNSLEKEIVMIDGEFERLLLNLSVSINNLV